MNYRKIITTLLIIAFLHSCASTIEIAGKNYTREEFEKLFVEAGKEIMNAERYKLAMCTLAAAAKMKFDEVILSKIYQEKAKESRSSKIQMMYIKSCMEKMIEISKIPVLFVPDFFIWTMR